MGRPRKDCPKYIPGKYVAYYRVSTNRQHETGLSIDAQREAARAYIGFGELVEEFTEIESASSYKRFRPQLHQAILRCKEHKAVLVIARLDRLSRNANFITSLLENDVEFVCCDNPHATKVSLQMLAVFAEHERDLISKRTRDALAAIKRELAANGSRVSQRGRRFLKLGNPRWQESIHKATISRKNMQTPDRLSKMIGDWRAAGRTLQHIADSLNSIGATTASGAKWYPSSVNAELQKRAKYCLALPRPA